MDKFKSRVVEKLKSNEMVNYKKEKDKTPTILSNVKFRS